VLTEQNGIICFSVFFLFWGLIILADMRDLTSDPSSLRTLPQLLGWRNAKAVAYIFFFQFHIISAIFNDNIRNNFGFHGLFIVLYGFVYLLNDKTMRHVYLYLDLALVFLGIVFYFAKNP
jgi:hypothetical protein